MKTATDTSYGIDAEMALVAPKVEKGEKGEAGGEDGEVPRKIYRVLPRLYSAKLIPS